MKILFITANRIGDAILSTGLLHHLVATYPGARITVACGPLCVDLFAAVPGLDVVIPIPKQSWNRHWWALWRRCLSCRWDIIVDLRDSIVSRLLRHGKLYTYRPMAADVHKVIVNAAIMGIDPPPDPKIWIDDDMRTQAENLLPGETPVLALGPSANWAAKQWPAEYFAELVTMLLADPVLKNARVLVLSAAHERGQIAPVLRAIPDRQRVELIGASLALAAACLQRSTLFIGNDSGLMHLAAAVGTPTIGLFGPGNEAVYGPWGQHTAVARTPEPAALLLQRLQGVGEPIPSLMTGLQPETVRYVASVLLKKYQ